VLSLRGIYWPSEGKFRSAFANFAFLSDVSALEPELDGTVTGFVDIDRFNMEVESFACAERCPDKM